jgi:DNA-binding HxlR family transcriptional regulator
MTRKMLETYYRASRFCRVIGNPTAYEILKELTKSRKTPSELAKEIRLSVKTISETLRNLRHINLVRYRTCDNFKIYSLKDASLPGVLKHIEKYVKKMRAIKW